MEKLHKHRIWIYAVTLSVGVSLAWIIPALPSSVGWLGIGLIWLSAAWMGFWLTNSFRRTKREDRKAAQVNVGSVQYTSGSVVITPEPKDEPAAMLGLEGWKRFDLRAGPPSSPWLASPRLASQMTHEIFTSRVSPPAYCVCITSGDHPAPQWYCSCGYYAVLHINNLEMFSASLCVGRVSAIGKAILCGIGDRPLGWRSERFQIEEIFLLWVQQGKWHSSPFGSLEAELAQLYQVPVKTQILQEFIDEHWTA